MSQPIQILSHRGIDALDTPLLVESTKEAFVEQLHRGFGIEFDLVPLADGEIVISHDRDLSRITNSKTSLSLESLSYREIKNIKGLPGSLITLHELSDLILNSSARLHALHLKAFWQSPELLSRLVAYLKKIPKLHDRILIFDALPQSASLLKSELPDIACGASITHPYDKARFNQVVGGTLLTLEELSSHQDLYSWAWLDEWDLKDIDGGTKVLYRDETFERIRNYSMRIAIVSPELHATSPGLLGGEAHPDGLLQEKLFARIESILKSDIDLICTDYPIEVKKHLA